jgi:hypothetical protein
MQLSRQRELKLVRFRQLIVAHLRGTVRWPWMLGHGCARSTWPVPVALTGDDVAKVDEAVDHGRGSGL